MNGLVGKIFNRSLCRFTHPVAPGIALTNFLMQRVLGVNNEFAWPIHFTTRAFGDIQIGKDVWISFAVSGGCYFQGLNGIDIGDNTIFAPNSKFISANHDMELGGWKSAPRLKIGAGCWIGANAVVLPGVELGDSCIVAAGAIVTKSFPEYSMVAGVPAVRVSKVS